MERLATSAFRWQLQGCACALPGLLLPPQPWDEALEAGAGARLLYVPQFHPCVVGFAFEAAINRQGNEEPVQNLE